MRAYIRRAVVPAVLLSALAVGCSSGGGSDKADPKPSASAEAVVDAASQAPSEAPSTSAPAVGPMLVVGTNGPFTAVDSADESIVTKMNVKVNAAKYVTAAELGTSNHPKNGQFVVLTLTIKNVGDKPGGFRPYGAMKWQDAKTAAQDASTLETTDGQDVDTDYQPGQSVTGDVVLDVVRKGGTVSYFDAPGTAAFTVLLPKS